MAGITPQQVDLLQTYDDYPVISVMQMEDLGFCDKGAAGEFIRENTFTIDVDYPSLHGDLGHRPRRIGQTLRGTT